MAKKKKQKQQLDKRINTALAAILIAIIGATACEMLLWGDWRAQNAELKTTCEAVKKEADIASQAPIELAEVRSQINELKKEISEAKQQKMKVLLRQKRMMPFTSFVVKET